MRAIILKLQKSIVLFLFRFCRHSSPVLKFVLMVEFQSTLPPGEGIDIALLWSLCHLGDGGGKGGTGSSAGTLGARQQATAKIGFAGGRI